MKTNHCLLLIFTLMFVVSANAAVLVEHVGANDPFTEGWGGVGQGISGNILEPVFNDQGRDSWRVDNFTNATGGDLLYIRSMQSSEVNDALTNGWSLRAIVKTTQASHSIIRFSTGTKLFDINLTTSGAGLNADPVVAFGGVSTTLSGGAGLYHEYLIQDEDANGQADLFIDGVLTVSGFSGSGTSFDRRVSFGDNAGSSSSNFNNNYSLVNFTIDPLNTPLNAVPEPTTTTLAILALVCLCASPKKRNTCK